MFLPSATSYMVESQVVFICAMQYSCITVKYSQITINYHPSSLVTWFASAKKCRSPVKFGICKCRVLQSMLTDAVMHVVQAFH